MPVLRHPLALVVAGALLMVACGGGDDEGSEPTGGPGTRGVIESVGQADEGIDGVQSYRIESNDHTDGEVDYDVVPPPGGPHNEVWANCGFYDEPVPDEHVVHDLEHGAVWLAYAPDLPETGVEALHDLARANEKVIATPHAELPEGAAVVATAWARQLVLETVDDPRLEQFLGRYQDGPQSPEAGVTCSDSPLGQPLP